MTVAPTLAELSAILRDAFDDAINPKRVSIAVNPDGTWAGIASDQDAFSINADAFAQAVYDKAIAPLIAENARLNQMSRLLATHCGEMGIGVPHCAAHLVDPEIVAPRKDGNQEFIARIALQIANELHRLNGGNDE